MEQLTFTDNGCGMSEKDLSNSVLSLGYTDKDNRFGKHYGAAAARGGADWGHTTTWSLSRRNGEHHEHPSAVQQCAHLQQESGQSLDRGVSLNRPE